MKADRKMTDSIDEALKLYYLSPNSLDGSIELQHILAGSYPIQISPEKSNQMIESLYEKLAVDSLGVILSKAIDGNELDIEEVAKNSNLPISTLYQLQADSIIANSIPIISLRNLLKMLQIPFDDAYKSIIKTFHILKSDLSMSNSIVNSNQLVYKRKNLRASINYKAKSDSKLLYQNEEALKIYLNRLGELFDTL